MRVVTWNIRHGLGLDRRVDLPRIAALLRRWDADVICLQEVDRHFGPRSAGADQCTELATACARHGYFGPALRRGPDGHRQYGNAILTRERSADVQVLALPGGGPGAEPRALLRLQYAGGTVASVHLRPDSAPARAAQVAAALAALGEGPWLLAGDFNAVPGAAELQALRRAAHEVGGGATFPSLFPRRRIDHVWLSGWGGGPARVLRSAASDHRPQTVDVPVTDGPRAARPRGSVGRGG